MDDLEEVEEAPTAIAEIRRLRSPIIARVRPHLKAIHGTRVLEIAGTRL